MTEFIKELGLVRAQLKYLYNMIDISQEYNYITPKELNTKFKLDDLQLYKLFNYYLNNRVDDTSVVKQAGRQTHLKFGIIVEWIAQIGN